jgi:hypothetical protein
MYRIATSSGPNLEIVARVLMIAAESLLAAGRSVALSGKALRFAGNSGAIGGSRTRVCGYVRVDSSIHLQASAARGE